MEGGPKIFLAPAHENSLGGPEHMQRILSPKIQDHPKITIILRIRIIQNLRVGIRISVIPSSSLNPNPNPIR